MTPYQRLREASKNLDAALDRAGENRDDLDEHSVAILNMGAELVQARALEVIAENLVQLTQGRAILRTRAY